ncbi:MULTISPECIES: zf-HC2 domain-containing protein [Micromonospora]|uniref:zf-HC2 domain-containing protein n=1 Tax=Micromonospora TaxID=1873 RepID=UPI001B39A609|nr:MULTISPECIES: zf-HC2 domain-containing protein [Micromonospora]MBQ0982530.1 zf-HC2 domain-containing protein [Micromonospora sp. M61]MBQ1038682.1 zf-HC2 domain-containing protein [Micromonospora sp. C81]WTE87605.1 zf-HC2 domain-containing protein [Micromonospora zamorensis]WTI22346.1 zf-HC2 domain-containing protein [Micromonospora zamorensis]
MPDLPALGDHVTDLLGPHYMGVLDRADSDAVDRHLRDCAQCRVTAREVCEVVAALALLSDDVAVEEASPVTRPAAPAARRGGSGSVRPAGGRPMSVGPGRQPRPRRQRLALVRAGLALAVVLFVGFGALFVLDQVSDEAGPEVVTVAASGSEPRTGAAASVFASETDSGVHVRVTVTGLRAGTGYQLYAVTLDGQTREIASWTSTDTVQEVSGDLPVALGDLVFVTISVANGAPSVTVHLPRATSTTPR